MCKCDVHLRVDKAQLNDYSFVSLDLEVAAASCEVCVKCRPALGFFIPPNPKRNEPVRAGVQCLVAISKFPLPSIKCPGRVLRVFVR